MDNKFVFDDEQERAQFKKNIETRNNTVRKLFKNGEQIGGYTLKLDYVFGINDRTISNQLILVGEGERIWLTIFSVSNMIVIKDMNTKSQTFLHRENRFKNVTALNAVQRKKDRILIAAGESTTIEDKQATIVVAKTHKQKWYILTLGVKGHIKQIQLNVEKKYCAAIVQPNNQNIPLLTVWNYKTEKLLASANIKAQFDKFSFHPWKNKNLLLSGHNYLRIWEIFFQEKQLKEQHDQLIPLKVEKENKFLDHCWVPGNTNQSLLVLLAQGNRVIIIQNDQLKKIIDIDVQNLNIVDAALKDVNVGEENEDIVGLHTVLEDMIKEKIGGLQQLGLSKETIINKQTSQNSTAVVGTHANLEFFGITATKRGFILGGSKGCICLYEFDKNFSIVNTLSFAMKTQSQQEHKIIYLSNSQNDSIITIISQTGANQLSYNVLNTLQLDTEVSPIQSFFSAGVHNKRVHSISSAITKQIFATSSEDNTVKIWNYYESETNEKKGVLSKYFKEEPLSVAMHPFGIFLTVGFANGFKVFAILTDSLFALKEVGLNNCRIVKYSNGGHFLMTNEKSNILIYDSIYYETISVLDGHTALIKDIAISENDTYIVSTCMNGYVFCWNLGESQNNILKEPEHQEQTIYNSIQYDVRQVKGESKTDEIDLFVGCTNEKYLCLYRRHSKELVAEFEVQDCYITKLVLSLSMKVLIAGTSKGSIRIMPWPLEEANLEFELVNALSNEVKFRPPEFFEIHVHCTAISALELSYDNQYLFTAADDGSVYMLKVKELVSEVDLLDQQKRQTAVQQKTEDKQRIAVISNDLFLDEIFKIQKENDKIQQRNFEVIKSEQTVRIETQKLEQMYKQKIEQINKDFQTTMESDRKMKDTFVQKSEEEYKKLIKQFEEEKDKYMCEMDALKLNHQSKIKYEQERNKELEDQIEDVKGTHKQDLMLLLTQHKDDLKKLKMNFYEKCQKVQVKYSNVVDNAKNYGTAFIQRLEKEDAEYEKEIDDQIKDLRDQIAKVKLANTKLESLNNTLIKSYEQLKREDEDLQNKFELLFKSHNQIRHDNLKNDEDILKMQHQLLERLQVIDSKEDTCKAAKDEQINLENFRYMLDQKIKSLQNDKTSLLNRITDKEKNLKSMFNELIKESNQNEQKYQELQKLIGEQEVLETQVKKAEIEVFLNANKLNHYESTLLSIIKTNDSPSQISEKLYNMIEHSQQNDEMQKIAQKKTITNDDIKDIIKLKQDKPNEVNDELLRQGKWMTKKLYLIKVTSDKLKEIREDNINTILNQNTKLIEECNMLRSENEKYRKKIKNVEKLLAEAIRKRQKLKSKQPQQYTQIVKKLEDNSQKIQTQKSKLANIKDSINDILNKPLPQTKPTTFKQQQDDHVIIEEPQFDYERTTPQSALKQQPNHLQEDGDRQQFNDNSDDQI